MRDATPYRVGAACYLVLAVAAFLLATCALMGCAFYVALGR